MRIGTAGVPISAAGKGTVQGLIRLHELGLNHMELQFVRKIITDKKKLLQIRETAKKYDISLTIHAPYAINLCSTRKKVIEDSIKRIKLCLDAAYIVGAKCVVFHPGYYQGRSSEECMDLVRDALSILVDYIEEVGMKVFLSPETTGKLSQFGSIEEILDLSKEFEKHIVPTIDIAHIYCRRSYEFESVEEYIDLFKKLKNTLGWRFSYLNFHFTCVERGEKGERRHLTWESRKPDLSIFARAIVEFGIHKEENISLVSESPILEEDALKLLNEIRKIARTTQ